MSNKIKILKAEPSKVMPETVLKLEVEQILNGSFRIYSSFIAPFNTNGSYGLNEECREWCNENLLHGWVLHSYENQMYFGSNTDLLMFKLRWV